MPNTLVRGHMRFDDSEAMNSFEEFVNKITNYDDSVEKSVEDLTEEIILLLKEGINRNSRITMKEIFSRYVGLLKKTNMSFDDLLE